MLIFYPILSLHFVVVVVVYCFCSGCEVRGPRGPGAHLPFRPKDGPQDDNACGGPCGPREATAAGVTPHPAAAANPEATPDRRISETARELDPTTPGPAPGAHQGSKRLLAPELFGQGACTMAWAEGGVLVGGSLGLPRGKYV